MYFHHFFCACPADTIHSILPPGYWHDVYTPVKTIVTGGHFILYPTLHLMEYSRYCDRGDHGDSNTNASHPSIPRTLAQMALAIDLCNDSKCSVHMHYNIFIYFQIFLSRHSQVFS